MPSVYDISAKGIKTDEYPGQTAQFFILKKADGYCGIGRVGIDLYKPKKRGLSREDKALINAFDMFEEDIDEFLQSEQNAERLLDMFREKDDYELILARVAGADDAISKDYTLLGYDVSYPLCFDETFSAVSIGAKKGDAKRLNSFGLFDSFDEAFEYLGDYAKAEYCDEGEYCICEIYKKGKGKVIELPVG